MPLRCQPACPQWVRWKPPASAGGNNASIKMGFSPGACRILRTFAKGAEVAESGDRSFQFILSEANGLRHE